MAFRFYLVVNETIFRKACVLNRNLLVTDKATAKIWLYLVCFGFICNKQVISKLKAFVAPVEVHFRCVALNVARVFALVNRGENILLANKFHVKHVGK